MVAGFVVFYTMNCSAKWAAKSKLKSESISTEKTDLFLTCELLLFYSPGPIKK